MAQRLANRTSRAVAVLVALGVQGAVLLALAVGLGLVPLAQTDGPSLEVTLLPVLRTVADMPAGKPRAHVHLRDPGLPPPVVPTPIMLPAPPVPPDPDVLTPRTVAHVSAAVTSGADSQIGITLQVEPEYPAAAVRRRSQGTTSIAFLVAADGHPQAVRILRSSGDPLLDEAAVRAVQQWEFTAATSHAQVVPRWARLQVNFDLTLYRKEHPGWPAGSGRATPDPVAALHAVIASWSAAPERRDALRRLLQDGGPVHSIRFIGMASRLPQGIAQPQELRTLPADGAVGWNVFEVTQQQRISQWYCALDQAGQIQLIVARDGAP